MFSCDFCEISNNTFFTKHLRTTASVLRNENFLSENKDIFSNCLHRPCSVSFVQVFFFVKIHLCIELSYITFWHSSRNWSGNLLRFSFFSACMHFKSTRQKVFLWKGVLKICSKFTGEHPCRSAISKNLHNNFIEMTLRHVCSPVNLLHILRTPFLQVACRIKTNTTWTAKNTTSFHYFGKKFKTNTLRDHKRHIKHFELEINNLRVQILAARMT